MSSEICIKKGSRVRWAMATCDLVREWYRRSSERHALAESFSSDARVLHDIGRSPSEVRAEILKWFWQA
jgi:uncharacterized protein YjiS (DUF1127 family)